jgi:UDP-glucose 4-epimerase
MAVCLVTGGAGFIGSHLVEALVDRGHRVRVLDNLSTGDLRHLARVRSQIDWIPGDVTELDTVKQATEGVEYVFHQAALASVPLSVVDPVATHQACATGTLHILVAAQKAQVKRVIYAASCNAYGKPATLPIKETWPTQPLSPYAVAKLTGEEYCVAFHNIYNLETVRLRYFNIFGPRQRPGGPYSAVIPLFIEAMSAGQSPVLYGDGLQSRDFTYVDDTVQANLLAMEAPRVAGRVYNIGSGRRTTLLEVVEAVNEVLGTRLKTVHDIHRPGEVRHLHADISQAQVELGYCPTTDLRRNLTNCVAYYTSRNNGHSPVTSPQGSAAIVSS